VISYKKRLLTTPLRNGSDGHGDQSPVPKDKLHYSAVIWYEEIFIAGAGIKSGNAPPLAPEEYEL